MINVNETTRKKALDYLTNATRNQTNFDILFTMYKHMFEKSKSVLTQIAFAELYYSVVMTPMTQDVYVMAHKYLASIYKDGLSMYNCWAYYSTNMRNYPEILTYKEFGKLYAKFTKNLKK